MSNVDKIRVLSVIFLAPFLILIAFLFRFQILEGAKYKRIAEFNFVRVQTLYPIRGEIYDRHFRPIAVNEPATNLYILPARVKDLSEVADFINRHLPVTKEELRELIHQNRFRAYQELIVYRNLDYEKVVEMAEQLDRYPSLFFRTENMRHYTRNNHFTGYVGQISRSEYEETQKKREQERDLTTIQQQISYSINCQIGKTGLEKQYEEYLRGKNGYRMIQVDASGRNIRVFRDDLDLPPINGSDMILTIDLKLQDYIESIFPKGYNGAILVLDTESGGVLSYVSHPVFDLNMFSKTVGRDYWSDLVSDPSFPLMDRVTMATYPPASTFKVVMTAVALDNDIIQPNTRLARCTGSYQYGNRRYRCWLETGHGSLTLSDAIKHSCNVYFFDLSLRVDLPLIDEFMHDNYLLERTGIDLPTERRGFFPSVDWYVNRLGSSSLITGHKINLAIGQGEVLLTPLQVGTFFNAIANDGHWKRPFIFSRLIGVQNDMTSGSAESNNRQLSITPETLEFIQQSIYRGVNESGGTGIGARVPGSRVYGKTGTAQNAAGSDPHVWFAGYAGWDTPEITVVVIVENYPGTGGNTAAPLAGRIIRYYQDEIRPTNGLTLNDNPN
jgi:penicillin-binding protein 2